MAVVAADVALRGQAAKGPIAVLGIAQQEGQSNACTDHVALQRDVHGDEIAALVLERDCGVGCREGAALPSHAVPLQIHVLLPRGAVEVGVACSSGGGAKHVAAVIEQLNEQAGRAHVGARVCGRPSVGLDRDHVIGLQPGDQLGNVRRGFRLGVGIADVGAPADGTRHRLIVDKDLQRVHRAHGSPLNGQGRRHKVVAVLRDRELGGVDERMLECRRVDGRMGRPTDQLGVGSTQIG